MLIVLNKQIDEFDEKVNNARRVSSSVPHLKAPGPRRRGNAASPHTATGIQ
jgi:hypothetical protein